MTHFLALSRLTIPAGRWAKPLVFVVAVGLLPIHLLAAESPKTQTSSSNSPVVVRHVQSVPFGPLGPGDAAFLCTNQTSHTILLSAPFFEIKSGSNWVTNSGPYLRTLCFVTTVSNTLTCELRPYEAAYCTIRFSSARLSSQRSSAKGLGINLIPTAPPPGSVWRLGVQVQNKLTGLADTSARAHDSATLLKDQLAGRTPTAANKPWSRATTYCSLPITTVLSDELPAP